MTEPINRPGFNFVAALPPGYDGRAEIGTYQDNVIFVTHPDLPPLVWDEATTAFVELKPIEESET